MSRVLTLKAEDAASPRPQPDTFLSFLESLYQDEYTGLIVLHFNQGIAKKAEFPGKQITLAR